MMQGWFTMEPRCCWFISRCCEEETLLVLLPKWSLALSLVIVSYVQYQNHILKLPICSVLSHMEILLEYKLLVSGPSFPSIKTKEIDSLGYNEVGEAYKLFGFEIFDFHSDSWRVLNVTPADWDVKCYQRGVSLKGNTYFFAQEKLKWREGDSER